MRLVGCYAAAPDIARSSARFSRLVLDADRVELRLPRRVRQLVRGWFASTGKGRLKAARSLGRMKFRKMFWGYESCARRIIGLAFNSAIWTRLSRGIPVLRSS